MNSAKITGHESSAAPSILGTAPIGKLLLLFSIPSVISMVLNALYNMVDQIFIGQSVGYLGNGATNVIFPLTQLAVAFGLLFGDGTASYIGLKLGQGDRENASRGMAAGTAGLLLSGLVLFILYNAFLEPLCWLFGATDATFPYAMEYGRTISLGIIFCVFASGSMSMIRADGSPGFAMAGMVTGCVINLIGDPVAIFVLHMGVRGAALATILGQFVNALMNLWYLSRCRSVTVCRQNLLSAPSHILSVAKMGLASFITQLAIVIVVAAQNNLLVSYGAKSKYGAEIPMSALGVTMKVFTILQFAVTGLAAGAQPIFSYNFGSGRADRVKSALRTVLVITTVFLLMATALFQTSPMSVVGIFGASDALYNEFSVKCLQIFLALLVCDGLQMVASSFLQSVGCPVQASVLVMFRQIILFIPAMLFLGSRLGVEGILWAGPAAGLFTGILSGILLMRFWHRRLRESQNAAGPSPSGGAYQAS